jgi:hypothetical protein
VTIHRATTFLRDLYGILDTAWADVQDGWTALRPTRFSLLAVILIGLVLLFADQAEDALINIAEDINWRSFFGTTGELLKIIGGTLLFCFYLWYWSFRAVGLRYPGEEETMVSYRTRFPPPGIAKKPVQARRQAAKGRVARIVWIRRWLPQALAYAAAVVVAFSLLKASAIAEERPAENLRILAFTIFVFGHVTWLLPRPPLLPLHAFGDHPQIHQGLMIIFALALSLFAGIALIWPVQLGQFVGPAVILLIAMCGLLTIFTPLAMWNRRRGFPVVAAFF